MEEYNENDKNRSIRAGDKLNYRAVIQGHISTYLASIDTLNLGKAVKALRNSVYFEVPGLPFRTEIIKKEKELMNDYRDNVMALLKFDRDCWIHPIKRMIYDTTFRDKYHMDLAEFLVDLIAKHDGLMQVRGNVEIGNTSGSYERGDVDV